MNVAETVLLLAVLAVPLALGVGVALARRPWWWAALAAIALAIVAAIAPTPEAGEPRVAPDDIGFLAVVAVVVAGLAWLGHVVTRRFVVRSSA